MRYAESAWKKSGILAKCCGRKSVCEEGSRGEVVLELSPMTICQEILLVGPGAIIRLPSFNPP